MKYECLSCHKSWGNQNASEENVSHGFCRRCVRELMKKYVWNRQAAQGFSQCYAKGYEDCTEYLCDYWDSCLEHVIQEWEKANLHDTKNKT